VGISAENSALTISEKPCKRSGTATTIPRSGLLTTGATLLRCLARHPKSTRNTFNVSRNSLRLRAASIKRRSSSSLTATEEWLLSSSSGTCRQHGETGTSSISSWRRQRSLQASYSRCTTLCLGWHSPSTSQQSLRHLCVGLRGLRDRLGLMLIKY
jgi:hypothetical protein